MTVSGVIEVRISDRRQVGCEFDGDDAAVRATVAIPVDRVKSVVRAGANEDATCHLVLNDGSIVVVVHPYYTTVKKAFEAGKTQK